MDPRKESAESIADSPRICRLVDTSRRCLRADARRGVRGATATRRSSSTSFAVISTVGCSVTGSRDCDARSAGTNGWWRSRVRPSSVRAAWPGGRGTPRRGWWITCFRRRNTANLNPLLHAVVSDGLFVADGVDTAPAGVAIGRGRVEAEGGRLRFIALPPPTTADVETLTVTVARRLTDRLAADAGLAQAAGEPGSLRGKPLCASLTGFSLHAAQSVAAHDREALERLCHYGWRAPFSQERLSRRQPRPQPARSRRRRPAAVSWPRLTAGVSPG